MVPASSAVIPPDSTNRSRTLVLCFDGTGDQFDADNSNIVRLVSLLKKNDKTKQMVYYQAGIGTYTARYRAASTLATTIRKTLDSMFASNIHAHVMSGYEFLMQNYIVGDKISIFGFSRGAYTARSLAGMLHKVGLLPADNLEQVPFAYKMYSRTDSVGWEQSREFKKTFSINVTVDFLGVWDTVDSVGIMSRRLPFTTSNTSVRTFRHAVSLDERRAKFKANLWNRPAEEDDADGLAEGGAEAVIQSPSKSKSLDSEYDLSLINLFEAREERSDSASETEQSDDSCFRPNRPPMRKADSKEIMLGAYEKAYSSSDSSTDVEEVWFAGCHSDVGGGSVSNKTRHSLARIPLRWMVRECFKANTGIMFISSRLHEIGMDASTLYPYVKERPPPLPLDGHLIRRRPLTEIPIRSHGLWKKEKEAGVGPIQPKDWSPSAPPAFLGSDEEEERMDALSPAYDQLKLRKSWWILELLPMQLQYQRGENQWVKYFAPNMARPRFIPEQRDNGVKVHRSVRLRQQAGYEEGNSGRSNSSKYSPRAHLRVEPTWVD